MATAILHPNLQQFPVGTTVGAYVLSGNAKLEQINSGTTEAPLSASVTTAAVQADGTLTFTGLADDTAYLAAAQVSSVWQRAFFHTAVSAAVLAARRPTWKVRRQALGLS